MQDDERHFIVLRLLYFGVPLRKRLALFTQHSAKRPKHGPGSALVGVPSHRILTFICLRTGGLPPRLPIPNQP